MTSSPMDDEIRGDWSNLKGTEYHLVYAIWLLLCRNAGSVAFYQGNDLLARPIPPPDPKNALSPAIHAQVANEDEWIQLKATRDSWTRSALLSGSLLANFIYNALASEAAGRSWRTRLVTQGEIQREEVEEFVADPGNHKELEEKLKKIIAGVQEHLKQNGGQLVDEQRLRTLALNILRQLAQEEPVSLAELKAQIEVQLAFRYLDPGAARQAGDKLLGAFLRDASAGPSAARAYDDGWLDYIAGAPLKSRLPFDTNPVSACDQAIEGISTLPGIQWQASLYAARRRLDSTLHHFLQAPETTFVLLGISGIGKSWAVADWTRRGLQGRVRLLIPGTDLSHEHQRALSRLAALRLRSFTSAPISDEDILAKLRAVARIDDKGPLVIVIDDVMPTGDINVFRRDLGQLVAECRRAKAKLVLTCQTHVWEFYRLGQHIPPSEFYSPDPVKPDTERVQSASDQAQDEGQRLHVRSSFILSDLTPEEQEEALSQRLPSSIAEHTAHLLREPAFVPLRRPYLLDLYLEQHKGEIQQATSALAPVDIDVLLDTHLKSLLRRVATSINVDEQDVQEAFEALQRQLWQARPNGLSTAEVEKCLEPYIGSRSDQAVEVFRQAGILTARGPMRFAESPLADRVFARTLNHHYDSGGDILSELRLEDDAGVVSALLRSLAHNNPVALAEALVKHNLQWMGPVAEGLAQCSSQDYRVLAFLTVLTRLREDHVGFEGCDALGHLAAYGHRIKNQTTCSQRAFEWVLQLYLSPRYEDRFRGGKALSVTLDLEPERVQRALRLRLGRAAGMDIRSSSNRKKRDQWLSGSFMPLLNIRGLLTARIGEYLLARYRFLGGQGTGEPNEDFIEDVEEVRGLIALFVEDEMARLSADLKATEVESRDRAAVALRTIMLEQPDRIKEMICEAIHQETTWPVMNRLLWATYRLTELAPDELLDALTGTFALNWSTDSPTTGHVLATLSNIALQRPERVASLLPQHLDPYPAWARALVSEMLAFAWWVCAEQVPQARDMLAELANSDLAEIPKDFRVLALRGAVVAQLGVMSLGLASMRELRGREILASHDNLPFLVVNTTDFVRSHAVELITKPDIDRLLDLLIQCLDEEAHANIIPTNTPLLEAHAQCAWLSLQMLISLAIVHSDPVPLLRRLPTGWRKVYAVRHFLQAKRRESKPVDPAIIQLARELCLISVIGGRADELEERERLLALLVSLSHASPEELQDLRAKLPTSPFIAKGRARAVAIQADEHPEEMLALLTQHLQQDQDLATLYQLVNETHSWQGLLIMRVFVRMFNRNPIHRMEARELCEQMLTAVRALPPTELQQEYLAVYSTIAFHLEGMSGPVPTLRASAVPQNVIENSHMVALELLRSAQTQPSPQQEASDQFMEELAALLGKGWWDGGSLKLEGDVMGEDSFGGLCYVFPAVRLALVAAAPMNAKFRAEDPAARFLEERAGISKLLNKHWRAFDTHIQVLHETLEQALAELKTVGNVADRDERVRRCRSILLLRLDRPQEAESELEECQKMPSYRGNARFRASVLYDLACAYARIAQKRHLCQPTLAEALQLHPQFRESLGTDPDFAEVREAAWFQELSKPL